ncbi:MAG TPA: FG-GAP repeat protein [Rudaea sp.]|nr:FG-GAP repeat protein [Rudaea sp.]
MKRLIANALILAGGFIAAAAPTFGVASTALHGQRLIAPDIGAGGYMYGSPAVNGDWIAAFGRLSANAGDGRVYVFHRAAGVWSLFQEIAPPDGAGANDALMFVGKALVVGSPGAYDPRVAANMGTVSIYTFQLDQWMLNDQIYSYTGFMGSASGFGTALAADADTLYVGFPDYVSGSGLSTGDVEAYDISSAPATYLGQIAPASAVEGMGFGTTLTAGYHTLAVGANDQGLPGVGSAAGVIYTFAQNGKHWTPGVSLESPWASAFDYFPSALTMDGSRIIAGDYHNRSQGKGGPMGVAFSYAGAGSQYSLESDVSPPDGYGNDLFGASVAAAGGLVMMGAPNTGDAGRVYAYRNVDGAWQQVGIFVTDDLATGDGFGVSLATDGSTLVVGATANGRDPAGTGAIYAFCDFGTDRVFSDGTED